MYTADS